MMMQRIALGLITKRRSNISSFANRLGGQRLFSATSEHEKKKKTPVSWVALTITGVVGGLLVRYYLKEKEERVSAVLESQVKQIGIPALGGPWTLVDHHGHPITDATILNARIAQGSLDKKYERVENSFLLLYFGFSHCPDICPAELHKMGDIIQVLDQKEIKEGGFKGVVRPVFISVDPKRDGVAQIAHYVKDFHPRMLGLTGTPQQIANACRAFRVYHNVADLSKEDEDDYLIDHSIVMYLIGPDGRFLDFYTQVTEVPEAAKRIAKQIQNITTIASI